MTQHEKQALIEYIDNHLWVLCQTMKPHVDPDAVGTLYESAYGILYDLQDTIMVDGVTQSLPAPKPRG